MHQASKRKRMIGVIGTLALMSLGGWTVYENVTIGISTYNIVHPNLPTNFDGFVIVQVSDLHNTMFGKNQKKLIEALTQAKPDLIVITGDFIDSRRTNVDASMQFIHRAVELAPVYYVTGNHESRIKKEFHQLEETMLAAGVHVLRDESEPFALENQSIQLIGLDDPAFVTQSGAEYKISSMVSQKLEQLLAAGTFTVLLSHRPELFDTYCASGVNLVFSGHAHGGQFRLPFVGGLLAPDQGLFPKYDAGSFQSGDTTMIVSRGLGNSIMPLRINNPPELIVVTLKNQSW